MEETAMQQQSRSAATIEVISISDAIGAEVRGVDLSKVDAAALKAIHDAWLQYAVLLFRDQKLSDDALADFSRNFGELDLAPPMETSQGETHPEILIVSNVKENGKAIGTLGDGGHPVLGISVGNAIRVDKLHGLVAGQQIGGCTIGAAEVRGDLVGLAGH
jgi:taurine dioxygenase